MPPSSEIQVFMSYSRRDDAVMRRIVTFLRNKDIKVWVDNEKLIPGTPIWEEEIEKAIKTAPAIVAVLSPDSKNSEWVRREISLADQYRKRVFPVLVRGDEESSITLRLMNRQYVDIRANEKAGLNALSMALSFYLEELSARQPGTWKEPGPSAAQKTEEHKPIEKEAPRPTNAEIYRRSYEASYKATQAFLPKLKIPALILVIGTIGYFLWQGVSSLIAAMPGATNTPQATMTATPTKTKTPAPTKTVVPTPTLGIGSVFESHGVIMLYVPKGTFSMGGESYDDEKPVHLVDLDAYYIDKYEVTNAAYKRCVDAGGCVAPKSSSSNTRAAYYGNPEFDEYPVVYVDWNMAKTYCEWRDARLPTEAEWEKAARGTDGRVYPWGENIDCDKANYQSSCAGDTKQVGSYLDGVSPYGAYDMSGNVWEWVSSLYKPYPYDATDGREDMNSSNRRALRGGSWSYGINFARSSVRYGYSPDYSINFVGFRCARSP